MQSSPLESGAAPVVSLKFTNFDAMAAAIANAHDVEFVQLERGRCVGELVLVDLGTTIVQFSRHALGNLAHATVAKERSVVVVPLSLRMPHQWNGHSIGRHELVAYQPGAEYQGCNPGGGQIAAFGVDAEGLATATAALTGVDQPSGGAHCKPFRPHLSAMRGLQAASIGAMALAKRNPGFLNSASARRGMERSLMTALVRALASGDTGAQASELTKLSHARTVAMAIDFLHAHPDEPIYIADLCVAAAVSERSLRSVFHEFYSMSPIRYLHVRRLNQVHRTLRDADPAVTTVTETATRFGFWELGRFSVDYRTLFGEAPSDTLKRAAR